MRLDGESGEEQQAHADSSKNPLNRHGLPERLGLRSEEDAVGQDA